MIFARHLHLSLLLSCLLGFALVGCDEVENPGGGTGVPPGTGAIPPPVPDDCITNVSPGDHTFTCQGVKFQVMVDEQCTKRACGLIFEVHGAVMSGDIMRTSSNLHNLGAKAGYLVVHPTSPTGAWDWRTHGPILVDFMDRMLKAFHADERRVHMTGFSMGSGMTFWFLCNHAEALASVGPVTGRSADQVQDLASGRNCIQSIDAAWRPRVPILFMSGTQDSAFSAQGAQERTDGIVSRLGLAGGDVIASGNGYRRRRWTGSDGMVFDFLTHDYSSSVLAGHCIPAPTDGPPKDGIFSCVTPANGLDWGKTVLQWFIEHPRGR